MRTPVIVILLAGLGACDSSSTGPRSGFWALRFWADEAKGPEAFVNEYGIPARDIVTPAGEPLPFLSDPFGPAEVRQRADLDGLNVVPGYSEGQPAAYLTAEVWVDLAPGEAWCRRKEASHVAARNLQEGSLAVHTAGQSPASRPRASLAWCPSARAEPRSVDSERREPCHSASKSVTSPGSSA